MDPSRRKIRTLLLAVFVPVALVLGVLAGAVLGSEGSITTPGDDVTVTAPPPVQVPASAGPVDLEPTTAAPPEEAAPVEPTPPEPWTPPGAERVDVGSGAVGAAIFRPAGADAAVPGPVVVFLHGWVAIDPERYGSWIGHLVRNGNTVIYPAYQTKPAYDTTTTLPDLLAGLRAAFAQVAIAPGRLVIAGHSAGGALAADYAAVAAANGMPVPAAVMSMYPGRKLRHLPVPIPSANLAQIAPGTRMLIFAGERDTAVGSETAHAIAVGATQADVRYVRVTDDAVDEHSAPRRTGVAAQQTFWAPLDRLLAATARG